MRNGNGFNVRSLTGGFCDISEIFFGRMMITQKIERKNSEWNKGNEHVFNPIVNVRSKLCHVAQYPVINIRDPHTPSFLKKVLFFQMVNVKCVSEGRNDARRCMGVGYK
jgi:hypothetical protein